MVIQPNKAIVGTNAFAHEAGIHQDGMLKNKRTYEIMDADTIGLHQSRLVLGKHSGRHALGVRLQELGYHLDREKLNEVFLRFKELADKKKSVTDADIEALVADELYQPVEIWELLGVQVQCGTNMTPTAVTTLRNNESGDEITEASFGSGPVDAAYQCIDKIVQRPNELTEFLVQAVTEGIDANGDVTVRIEAPDSRGHSRTAQGRPRRRLYSGRGVDNRHYCGQRQSLFAGAEQSCVRLMRPRTRPSPSRLTIRRWLRLGFRWLRAREGCGMSLRRTLSP